VLSVHIICVGKMKEKFYIDAAAEYVKRLGGYCKLTITELTEERLPADPSQGQIDAALAREAAAIQAKLPPNAAIVAMCVEGKTCSSPELAAQMLRFEQDSAKHVVFLIGGSCGLDEALKRQARLRLSMSPMTFPHHLARVMLLEQIYRAFKINEGSSYHK